MNWSNTSLPAVAAVPIKVPERTNHAKLNTNASVRIMMSRFAEISALNLGPSHNRAGARMCRPTKTSPKASAVHSANAVPAPMPAGPQSSPATNQKSSPALTPFSTSCTANSWPVRPVPNNQPVIASPMRLAGAPKIRALK